MAAGSDKDEEELSAHEPGEVSPDLSEELARLAETSSLGSGLDSEISKNEQDDDDDPLQGDTWLEELECALLADCDPATLRKISEGRRIPASLRPDYWKALLALNDTGKVKLTSEFDLANQDQLRQDCERLIDEIDETGENRLSEAERLQLRSDFESTLTTYVKARPEVTYVRGNGWTDILRVLYNLKLPDVQLYQMFLRIVDRYIPRDLFQKGATNEGDTNSERSTQAYHLLRLLIQYHDPELCSILDSRKVTPNLYVRDWFCCLFARSCPAPLALLIWDTHFKMADPFLIFFAAIVMVANASDELKGPQIGQADMLRVLRLMPGKLAEEDIEDLYYLVSNHYTNSTPRSIRAYSHLFFMDTFGNTYLGATSGSSADEQAPMIDLRTSQLTNGLDLSQYLCLPIVPAEIVSIEAQSSSLTTVSSTTSSSLSCSPLRYFLVDCRPAEQYNAGHLRRAFHLDCSLMLREPSSFAAAVQALLEIQRQTVASRSVTGGQHLCFIGSGQEEEDQYVNMVVASFLQRHQKYVGLVVGGFSAIHDYVLAKGELSGAFDTYIVDHSPDQCKTCYLRSPEGLEKLRAGKPIGGFGGQLGPMSASDALGPASGSSQPGASQPLSAAQMLFASTTSFLRGDKTATGPTIGSALTKLAGASGPQATATANLLAQSGASMFDKFTTAFVSRSSVIRERLAETLNTAAGSQTRPDHVSSQDKLGRRYTGGPGLKYAIDDQDDQDLRAAGGAAGAGSQPHGEPLQEVELEPWQRQANIQALYKCTQLKGNTRYPGHVALSASHLWILREIPHNKGFASIAAKRPLDMIVQITSKRRQPDLIIFRYGFANQALHKRNDKPSDKLPSIVAQDQLHIPQAFEVIRLIKREIVRIMDENSRSAEGAPGAACSTSPPVDEQQQVEPRRQEQQEAASNGHEPDSVANESTAGAQEDQAAESVR